MKRVFGYILLPITLVMSLSKGMLLLILVGFMALNMATVVFSGVFNAVSSAVEAVTGPRTVRASHDSRVEEMQNAKEDLVGRNRALTSENERLERELRTSKVNYRGNRRFAREAVQDTSERLARRITIASGRNVAAVAGEALPFVGVGVIVGGTAWELKESCDMMKDIHELDVAFNPENAIEDSEVCGMRVPNRAEVWSMIRESPGSAWNAATSHLPDVPDFSQGYSKSLDWIMDVGCGFFTCDAEVEVTGQ